MNVVPLQTKEPDLQIEFSDFWGMYPRRVAKKDARRAWEKIPASQHQTILAALFEWRRIWLDRDETDFIPYPASWLNGERWEDEFPRYHRPYVDCKPAEKQSEPTEAAKKPMPAHVREALAKIRAAQ